MQRYYEVEVMMTRRVVLLAENPCEAKRAGMREALTTGEVTALDVVYAHPVEVESEAA